MIPFSGMITHDGTITFTHMDGRVHNVLSSHPTYSKVKDVLRKLSSDSSNEELRMELFTLSQPAHLVKSQSGGRVEVCNNEVLYDGKPIKNFIAERIIWMINEGFDVLPMMAFLEKVKENSSNRAVEELYRFMEANRMGLTSDGMILAYKRVSAEYLDIYSGTISNRIGDRPSIPRNEVNDNPNITCSHGLHVCAMSYLPHYQGQHGNHVMICAVHPRDVVSVPIDYNNAKIRVCAYEVIGEITDQLDDILGRTPVWSDEELSDELISDQDVETKDDDVEDCDNYWLRRFRPTNSVKSDFNFTEFVENTSLTICRIVGNYFAIDGGGFPMNSTLKSLGADELDAVEVFMSLEEEFKIDIDDSLMNSEMTILNILDIVLGLLS